MWKALSLTVGTHETTEWVVAIPSYGSDGWWCALQRADAPIWLWNHVQNWNLFTSWSCAALERKRDRARWEL